MGCTLKSWHTMIVLWHTSECDVDGNSSSCSLTISNVYDEEWDSEAV